MELTRLNDIGFADFTTQLINDVFDGLVTQNINQMQAYLDLVEGLAATNAEYVASAYDSVSGDLIDALLYKALPDTSSSSGAHLVSSGTTLTSAQVDTLNGVLELDDESGGLTKGMDGSTAVEDNQVVVKSSSGEAALSDTSIAVIREAAARKLAYKQLCSLREMARLGMLRLVVDSGSIETRITFSTWSFASSGSDTSSSDSSSLSVNGRLSTGSGLKKWLKLSVNGAYNQVNVRTATEYSRDTTGTSLQIYGSVKVSFKTDYMPIGG